MMNKKHYLRLICVSVCVLIAGSICYFAESDTSKIETHIMKYDTEGELISKDVFIDNIDTKKRFLFFLLFGPMFGLIGFGVSLCIEGIFDEVFIWY